jgi:hypothetical protein
MPCQPRIPPEGIAAAFNDGLCFAVACKRRGPNLLSGGQEYRAKRQH